MCGIAGIYNYSGSNINKNLLIEMCEEMRHRGPDDEGYALYDDSSEGILLFGGEDTNEELGLPRLKNSQSDSFVGFGFRRLSILDLTPHGHQPMVSDNQRYMMVFNGEIYNYMDIRSSLERLGYIFVSESDSEVVLKAYQEWGEDSVKKFNGMWSICIFDAKNKSLFCSRDRFGIKPFYYFNENGVFLFSSEIKQLLLNKQYPRIVDEEAAANFLFDGTKDYSSKTMFKGIFQLEPGCNMTLRNGCLIVDRYWDFSIMDEYETVEAVKKNKENNETQFQDLFFSAVKLRLKADVPVGVALSGGIDSSSTSVVANELSNDAIRVFTVIFDEKKYDERSFAKIVSDKISCVKYEVQPDVLTLQAEINDFIFHMEEPIRGISAYSQWCLMRHVKDNGVTVLLEGQGADELLGGYEWYFNSFFSDIARGASLSRFMSEIKTYKKNYKVSFLMILKVIIKAYRNKPFVRKRNALFNYDAMPKLKGIDLDSNNTKLGLELEYGLRVLIRELLNYGDKSSMKFSVENRVPFLDYRLVEFATQLPLSSKIYQGDTKSILRDSLRDYLPKAIRKRYSKLGYASPQEKWQKNELKNEIYEAVLNSNLFSLEIFNSNQALQYFNGYFSGEHNDYHFVWRCYSFVKWMSAFKMVFCEGGVKFSVSL